MPQFIHLKVSLKWMFYYHAPSIQFYTEIFWLLRVKGKTRRYMKAIIRGWLLGTQYFPDGADHPEQI